MLAQRRTTLWCLEYLKNNARSQWHFLSRSYSVVSCKNGKMAPLQERRMIDRFRLWAKGGDGGNGCSSFRRSRHDRRGRPDGGNGGRGGDVILQCSTSVWDFSSLQHHVNAKKGGHGAPKNMIGSRGADKVVLVPVGTSIHLLEGEIPYRFENKSSEPLDPWDIPGALDLSHESSQQTPDVIKSTQIDNKVSNHRQTCPSSKATLEKQKRISQFKSYNRRDLLYRDKKSLLEPDDDFFPKPHSFSEWEDFEDETSISETDFDEESDETQKIQYNVAELTEPGQRITVAHGGDGGLGNIHSPKGYKRCSDTEEASDDEDQATSQPCIGSPGSDVVLLLELKSIADVGLVGLPNAGKSTLLGALSRAKPAVGHYSFTTLRPNLGNLNYDDISITVADIPGLIRGAHENRGLGHAFLRHIERTKVLVYVVDLAAALDGKKGTPPWEQLRDLMLELEYYREGMSGRPCLVVANKIDETGAEEVYEELRQRVTCVPIFPVCAVLEEGIAELKDGLKMLVSGKESSRLKLDNIML